MPHTARHALPRSRAGLLPGMLLLAAGTALGGLAVLPGLAAADKDPKRSSARAAATDRAALDPAALGLAAGDPTGADGAARTAQILTRERLAERASRDRRPAPAVAIPAPPSPPQYVRPGTGRLTSSYGSRWGRLHTGIDLAAGTGAPISAVAAGAVVTASSEGGYGHVVRVQHDPLTVTVYAHLSEVLVVPGQRVSAGTHVGREGSSGRSTGPHLHFEVRVDGAPVDPLPWLRARGIDPAAS